MPTNRKVIDFKIHNLTEEQFQELKEAGQIDPNAIYCTPDETVANFEAVNARIDETNKKLNTFESGVNETVGVINTTIVNVDKKVDEAIQTEQQHNIEINARVDETVANFEEVNARIDTKQDITTAVNYSHVTNCITEIPQDIKLELNNDTLTLKAGSKVYVPNGVGVFNEVVRNSDLVYNFGSTSDGQYLIFNSQYFYRLSQCVSGATDSRAGQGYHSWYDMINNLVKQYWADGSTPATTDSLPVAIITISGGVIASIDQVFNGFGYIDSTAFVLPGVKGLIPDGRNEDGTLKNIEFESTKVTTTNLIFSDRYNLAMTSSGKIDQLAGFRYDPEHNYNYNYDRVSTTCDCGVCTRYNDRIISFTPKTAFHAVDYNDTEFIAHQAMPSSRYVDLTLGASGTQYTAPADGYLCCVISASTNGYVSMYSNYWQNGTVDSAYVGGCVPIRKGAAINVFYEGLLQVVEFRFRYAVGAK